MRVFVMDKLLPQTEKFDFQNLLKKHSSSDWILLCKNTDFYEAIRKRDFVQAEVIANRVWGGGVIA